MQRRRGHFRRSSRRQRQRSFRSQKVRQSHNGRRRHQRRSRPLACGYRYCHRRRHGYSNRQRGRRAYEIEPFRRRKGNHAFKAHPSQHKRESVLGVRLQRCLHSDSGRCAVLRPRKYHAESYDCRRRDEPFKRMRRSQRFEAESRESQQRHETQKTARRF